MVDVPFGQGAKRATHAGFPWLVVAGARGRNGRRWLDDIGQQRNAVRVQRCAGRSLVWKIVTEQGANGLEIAQQFGGFVRGFRCHLRSFRGLSIPAAARGFPLLSNGWS